MGLLPDEKIGEVRIGTEIRVSKYEGGRFEVTYIPTGVTKRFNTYSEMFSFVKDKVGHINRIRPHFGLSTVDLDKLKELKD